MANIDTKAHELEVLHALEGGELTEVEISARVRAAGGCNPMTTTALTKLVESGRVRSRLAPGGGAMLFARVPRPAKVALRVHARMLTPNGSARVTFLPDVGNGPRPKFSAECDGAGVPPEPRTSLDEREVNCPQCLKRLLAYPQLARSLKLALERETP